METGGCRRGAGILRRSALVRFADAGFDEVYVANTGPHYEGLFDLYAREVLPRVR